MQDEHGLTIKQRKFADAVISGSPAAQAVIQAGYSPSNDNARYVQAYRLANHPNIRQYVLEALDRNGCTPDAISARLYQLMHTELPDEQAAGKRISLDSARELNKMIGAHAPTESRKLQVVASYQGRSPAELRYMAQHGRRPTRSELAAIESKSDE